MRRLQWRDRARLALASRYAIHPSYQAAFYTVNDCLDRYIASDPALNEALPVKKFARLTLLCRGATLSNRKGGFDSGEPILPMDETRAQQIARHMGRFDALVTAPERSALQTAAAFQAESRIEPAIRDLSYGTWQSRTLDDIASTDPHALQAWLEDPHAAPHGGESLAGLFARVSGWMDDSLVAGGHSLVVTHAPVIRAAILKTLAAPLASFWHIDIEPLAVADIRSDGCRWALRALGRANETAAE
jgi:broad specificity phosphatase PhoE